MKLKKKIREINIPIDIKINLSFWDSLGTRNAGLEPSFASLPLSFPIGLVKTKSNLILKSVETNLVR